MQVNYKKHWHKHVRKKPCIRCGDCCRHRVCQVGIKHGVLTVPCKYLITKSSKRTSCQIYLGNRKEAVELQIGVGCGYRSGLEGGDLNVVMDSDRPIDWFCDRDCR